MMEKYQKEMESLRQEAFMTVKIHPIKLGVDNCYILQDKGTVVIDGGGPNTIKKFKTGIERLKVDPGEIRLIILTHGHWDHIGSARDLKALTGAQLALHNKEKDWLENSMKPMPPGVSLWGHHIRWHCKIVLATGAHSR